MIAKLKDLVIIKRQVQLMISIIFKSIKDQLATLIVRKSYYVGKLKQVTITLKANWDLLITKSILDTGK